MPDPTSAFAFLQSQTVLESTGSPDQSVDRPAPSDAVLDQPSQPEPASSAPAEHATDLRSRGHRILTRDGRLFVDRASQLSDHDRQIIKSNKAAYIALAEPWPERERFPPADPYPKRVAVEVRGSMADFLGMTQIRSVPDWTAQEPPNLDAADEIILNFETNGLDWLGGHQPIGVTVGTRDGQVKRFLPFAFHGGGNLDRSAVIAYLKSLRRKKIYNANTRFDIHMAHTIDVDFEAQGCTVGDVMHYAALLDDHRRKFALDVLAKDYLGGIDVPRMDERNMAQYSAAEVAARAEYQVQLVAELLNVMWPEMDKQDLHEVRQLEDECIYPIVEMERNGSPIDEVLLDQMHTECIAVYERMMFEIAHECGFGFEHTTAGWSKLFEYCGLRPSEKGYAEPIIRAVDHPLIQKAYAAGQYASLDSKTFTPYKQQIRNGILYYDINQLRGEDGGTVSGRTSIGYVQQVPNHDNHHAAFGSRDGHVDDCSGRCYLFPRRVFIPGLGAEYVDADAAQIEYRLFAHYAKNKEVIQAYKENPRLSFHKKMWAMLKAYKSDMLYVHTKSFDFAKQYGAKSIKLAVMMGFITDEEGNEIRSAQRWNDPRLDQIHEIEAAFKRAMPEGDYLLNKAAHLAKSECDKYCKKDDFHRDNVPHQGFVRTLCGRRSRFPKNYKTYVGLNRVLQGGGADIMKRKMAILHRERRFTQFLMRLTVHDSVTGDGQTEDTASRVQEILNDQSYELRVPILWEVKTGPNWAECH